MNNINDINNIDKTNTMNNPCCPYCGTYMSFDEVYPYQATTYKCACKNWKRQEEIKTIISTLERNIDELKKELFELEKNSKRYKEIKIAQENLNMIKTQYCKVDGTKWDGRD